MNLVKISDGNSKLGNIPNVSMVPGKDCGNCSYCAKGCYAMKAYRMYKATKAAWESNSDLARNRRQEFFEGIIEFLEKKRPEFFRWHVAGDILDQAYLDDMIWVAKVIPDTKYLAFTKMHHLDFSMLPGNLVVVASMWPGMPEHPNVAKLHKAWMQDGTETRVPETAIPCPGICESCGMCWALPKIGRDVVFKKH